VLRDGGLGPVVPTGAGVLVRARTVTSVLSVDATGVESAAPRVTGVAESATLCRAGTRVCTFGSATFEGVRPGRRIPTTDTTANTTPATSIVASICCSVLCPARRVRRRLRVLLLVPTSPAPVPLTISGPDPDDARPGREVPKKMSGRPAASPQMVPSRMGAGPWYGLCTADEVEVPSFAVDTNVVTSASRVKEKP
jgi:hypothetical protein